MPTWRVPLPVLDFFMSKAKVFLTRLRDGARNLFLMPVYFYRKFISPHTAPHCRFNPTCSQYAVDAVKKRGIIIGTGLTIWRILRCNPFCKGGYDPVPEPKKKKT